MPNQALSKHDWATAVVAHVNTDPASAENLILALQSAADDLRVGCDQIPDPQVDPFCALMFARGQVEVLQAYESGDSPTDYASFVTTEWDLYGFPGE